MNELKEICVPRRCGLCRFKLQLGDNIIAIRRPDTERSQPYAYSILGVTDIALGVEYVQCRGRCDHDEQRAGCHVDCVEITSSATLANILEVTSPAFEPSPLADKRRLLWLRSWLASVLQKEFRRLPTEIINYIAILAFEYRIAVGYAYKSCAKMISEATHITTLEKIYAHYVEFEGIRYIACLTNAANDSRDVLLFDPTSLTSPKNLYVATDHLGIRQLLFANSADDCIVEQEPGVWWRTVALESFGGLVEARSDGLKLREIVAEPTVLSKVAWGLPQPLHMRIRLESICNVEPSNQMSVVSCNDPRTTAYSLCWDSKILMLHAHSVKESLDFYHALENTDEAALWLYMPLHAGEVLTEIWKFNGPIGSAIALLLVTNQGRSNFLGVQPRPHWSRSEWTLLDLPSKAVSRIYLETTTCGVRKLGFETSRPKRQPRPSSVVWPTSAYPVFRPDEHYAWSSAKLDNVVEIIPCQRQYRGTIVTIGLVLRYADRKQGCVGQIRLDCIAAALRVDPACKLWLGFWLTDNGPCVSSITLAREEPTLLDTCTGSWFGVDWCDDLEWWYSQRQCQLSYQGRLSPETTQKGRSRG